MLKDHKTFLLGRLPFHVAPKFERPWRLPSSPNGRAGPDWYPKPIMPNFSFSQYYNSFREFAGNSASC